MAVAVKTVKKPGVKKPGPPKKSLGEAPKPESAKKEQPKQQRPKEFKISVDVYQGANRLTVEQAKELLGWTIVGPSEKGQKGTGSSYDGKFHIRDRKGNKILLKNNSTNRPFRPGLSKRYQSDMIRRKWHLNGESIVFDWMGKCQSGQHRLVGFILAEELRQSTDNKDQWVKKYWKGPIVIDALIVKGISDEAAVIDSIDQGQKRTLGDVFFRSEVFGDGSVEGGMKAGSTETVATDAVRKTLTNILANAVRLVWLRSGGKKVGDAPHFPVSEAMEFYWQHERIKDAVLLIHKLEGGSKLGGQKISKFLSMGYAAALMYLMSAANTDSDVWEELAPAGRGGEAVDLSMEATAKIFWEKFASGANLSETDPIYVLREALRSMDAGSADNRDEIVGMVIKAYNLWADNQDKKGNCTYKASFKDLQMRRMENDMGKRVLAEDPRLGGIDIEGKPREEQVDDYVDTVAEGSPKASSGKRGKPEPKGKGSKKEVEKYNPQLDEREGHKAGKQWAEGDTVWVRDPEGEHWFGTITNYYAPFKEAGSKAAPTPASVDILDDMGREFNEPVSLLCIKYPK